MKLKRWTAAILAVLIATFAVPIAEAENIDGRSKQEEGYSVNAMAFTEASAALETGTVQGEEALLWTDEIEWIEWEITVPEAGEYRLELTYCPLKDTGMDIRRGVQIGGESQHTDHENVALSRYWAFTGEPFINTIGDEVSPMQAETLRWRTAPLMDGEGLETRPLTFRLEAGANILRLQFVSEGIALRTLTAVKPEQTLSYGEWETIFRQEGYTDARGTLRFEAEDALAEKNSSTVFMSSDSEPSMVPANGNNKKINMVGGWQVATEATWSFTVTETGLYELYLRDNVSGQDNMSTYCTVRVDGEVPYAELWEYALPYSTRWRTETLRTAEGKPMKFYLEAGEHTLSVRTVCGPLNEAYRLLYSDYMDLTRLIRDIIKVTGSTPDVNYDYQITTAIPTLVPRLQTLVDNLTEVEGQVEELTGDSSRLANQIHSVIVQFTELVKKPDTIPRRLSDLQTLTNTYASVVTAMKSASFALDSFWWAAPEEAVEDYKSNIFQKIGVFFRDFYLSFVRDYTATAAMGDEIDSVIDVWVARGKEWAEIIQRLTDTYFTPEYKVGVRINVLPTGQLNAGGVNPIMLSIAAGKEPDVALGVSANSPFEYAIRNAAADLSRMEGFDRVYGQFLPGLFIPMTYNEGVYGLPESATARVMYYRTDIFEELGLEPPDTWDEVYNTVLPLLYKNGMEMCIPNMYDVFLYQNGGRYYTEDGLRSGLDSREAYLAFAELISLYTDYGVPVAMSFFNRFRTGEVPIGIDTISSYMMFRSAAPEIAGRWAIAPIPGKEKEDGEIDRSYAGMLGEACFILNSSAEKENGWKYISWWTSNETQIQFQRDVESRMGTQARWLSANTAAFESLPWTKDERAALEVSRRWGTDAPQVIGGYFSGRHITNAFTRCVVDGDKPRDSLEECVEDINVELIRRQKDFGIEGKE